MEVIKISLIMIWGIRAWGYCGFAEIKCNNSREQIHDE